MVKIIRASKGSPQELEMLVENRIAELEDRDIAEATSIESARGNRGQLYVDMDGSIAGLGETIGLFELREMYDDLHDGDPSVEVYDTFESWLRDTVDNGFLKPIRGSFVYPDDLEDLENGEYESHVTEPINCSAIVRPVGYKSWGVYLPDGHNHAEKLFESESEDECYDWINDNQKVIWEKEAEMNTVEGASGSPQELQMLVENRLDRLESGVDASFVYPEDLIDLENGEYESHVTEPINAAQYTFDGNSVELDENEQAQLYDFAESFTSSEPLSGDWDTEDEMLQRGIADMFDTGMWEAKEIMKRYLGYTDDMFACNTIESAEGVPGIDFDDEYEEIFDERHKPDIDAIVNWLWEHPQAYSDACHKFRVPKFNTGDGEEWDNLAAYVDEDRLIDWIADHDQLRDDFNNKFGPEWIESCTNTANIMSSIDDELSYAGKVIKAIDEIVYPNLSDRYTCLNDVQAQFQKGKIGHNDGLRVTVSFVDDIQEGDIHFAVALKTLKEYCDTPEDAAYWIQNEIEDQWGDELDQLEADFCSADWTV